MNFLHAIEQSGFSTWIRESPSVWAYPTILFAHTVGLGFLVGASMVIDLRMLGLAAEAPLGPMKKFFSVMWIGFGLTAVSGVLLVMIDATKMLTNPLFYIKIGFIGAALTCGRMIWKLSFQKPALEAAFSRTSKILAGASLVLWIGAITAGRLTAYLFA
jgi:hypothetical protein